MQRYQETTKLVVCLNNRGVRSYQKGSFEAATTDFSRALRKSKALFYATTREIGGDATCNDRSLLLADHLLSIQAHEECRSLTSNIFIYEQAVSLPEFPAECIEYSRSFQCTILSVIIFNLSLVHQMVGLQIPSSSEVMLTKSVKLYELALQLQHPKEHDCQGILFRMVVLNNLGQAFRALGQCKTANQRCFVPLLSLTMYLMTSSNFHRNDSRSLQEQQRHLQPQHWAYSERMKRLIAGFAISTSHLILSDKKNAASAA